jgi:hypothetical protein
LIRIYREETDSNESVNRDVAKVLEAADPRRPGRSHINILRVLDNKGDAASQSNGFEPLATSVKPPPPFPFLIGFYYFLLHSYRFFKIFSLEWKEYRGRKRQGQWVKGATGKGKRKSFQKQEGVEGLR